MRIAFVAPLVTSIREPQAGGSQALLADLAAGLTSRGHVVDVYAATGSEIPGVRVIDTGVDPDRLTGSL
ncbi:MAG: glycosyltransferase family 4 protein [Chloroflexi bacterium]|nr:MAG: glycosyltransferase family 4 protein [Chloroflexota bacterium]